MITGMKNLLGELEMSNFQFHLTGSRAFGNSTKDSDWDFFCANNQEVLDYLLNRGYIEDSQAGYFTSSLVLVKDNIHIQLVDNFEQKLKVNNLIQNNIHLKFVHNSLSKGERKHLWKFLLSQ